MPLPANFNKYAHFISTVKASFNPIINELFDGINETDLIDPKGALKQALLVQDDDTLPLVVGRFLFGVLGAGINASMITDGFYGVPKTDFKQSKNGIKQQIILHFREPEDYRIKRNAKNGKRVNISINLSATKSSNEITATYLDGVATKINTNFPVPKNEKELHYCGRKKYSYYDPDNGVQITQLTGSTFEPVKALLIKVFDTFNLPFNDGLINESKRVNTSSQIGAKVTGFVMLKSVHYVNSDDSKELLLSRSSFTKFE